MTQDTGLAVVATPHQEHPAWADWLAERLLPGWRAAEWDESALRFTAVPGNPATSVFICRVNSCSTHVAHNGGRCSACSRARWARGNPSDFDETYVPDSARRRPNVSDGPLPGVSQFSLSGVSSIVRREILYGIQQRDAAGINLVPQRVRRVVAGLPPGLPSLLDLDESFARGLPAEVAGFLNGVLLHVQRARLQFDGGDATSGDVWQSSLVGLTAGRGRKYAAVHGVIDFRPIQQQWLREMVKEYGRTARPNVLDLRQTLYAASIAAVEMRRRLEELPENERAAVEAASRELRKARSAAAFIPVQSLTTRSAR